MRPMQSKRLLEKYRQEMRIIRGSGKNRIRFAPYGYRIVHSGKYIRTPLGRYIFYTDLLPDQLERALSMGGEIVTMKKGEIPPKPPVKPLIMPKPPITPAKYKYPVTPIADTEIITADAQTEGQGFNLKKTFPIIAIGGVTLLLLPKLLSKKGEK